MKKNYFIYRTSHVQEKTGEKCAKFFQKWVINIYL